MKLIKNVKGKYKLNAFIDWIIYMVFYTIVLICVSNFFKSMYIDPKHPYIYAFLIVLVVYLLDKGIKPTLVKLTIPITGITVGLFYPFINLFILKLADWILGSHFNLENIKIALFISILLSLCNFLVSKLIVEPLIKVLKKEGEKFE